MAAVKEKLNTEKPKAKKSSGKFLNSMEYELIARTVLQHYQKEDKIRFDLLLSIPSEDRIPYLTEAHGHKRMHQLLQTIIRSFCFHLALPKAKTLTETKMSVLACELMITAHQDNLSLEDIMLFFERARHAAYGRITNLLHHQDVMYLLEQYRQERHEAYIKIQERKEEVIKHANASTERICKEPTSIGELVGQALVINMNAKMSG